MFELLIGTAAAQEGGAPAAPGGGGLELLLFFGSIVAIWWFLVIRPQAKQQQKHQSMVSSLKKGDRVVTASGMLGKVAAVEEAVVIVEVDKGTKLRFLKDKIATVGDPTAKAPTGDAAADDSSKKK